MPQNKIEKNTHDKTIRLEFASNASMSIMCGEQNKHLKHIEQALNIKIDNVGNQLSLNGPMREVHIASLMFSTLYQHLNTEKKPKNNLENNIIDCSEMINDMLRQAEHEGMPNQALNQALIDKSLFATTWKRNIFPRTTGQMTYMKLLRTHEVVFGLGPAGTGKTYLAVAWAVHYLKTKQIERIILARPAVEAGERLGFLPGDMKDKIDPYLRPIYDALYDMMPHEKVERMLNSGEIEIAPIAFMRGRTLAKAFVIIDEAQNTTPVQMKMVLTRMGEHARMIVTGDLSQIDLAKGQISGLADAVKKLNNVKGVGITELSAHDVVRHPVVARILRAYEGETRHA